MMHFLDQLAQTDPALFMLLLVVAAGFVIGAVCFAYLSLMAYRGDVWRD